RDDAPLLSLAEAVASIVDVKARFDLRARERHIEGARKELELRRQEVAWNRQAGVFWPDAERRLAEQAIYVAKLTALPMSTATPMAQNQRARAPRPSGRRAAASSGSRDGPGRKSGEGGD